MKKFREADVDTIKKYVEKVIKSVDGQAKPYVDNMAHHIVDKTQKGISEYNRQGKYCHKNIEGRAGED